MSDASTHAATDPKPSAERPDKTAPSDRAADESKDSGAEQPQHDTARVAPVTRLYQHALESIFAFLQLNDLSRVLSVSQSWSAAVRSMPSIGAAVASPRVPPSVMAASGLVSHVIRFGSSPFLPQCSCHDLHVLHQSFPALTSLNCSVLMPQPEPLVFSLKLRHVCVDLRGDVPAAVSIQDTIATLSQLPQLTDLAVIVHSWFPSLDFSPLLGAASLRHLRIQSQPLSQPTAQQIDQLRSLAHLQSMLVPRLNSASIESLLHTPHQLRWQRIGAVCAVDEVKSAALSCLPTLTSLEASSCSSVAFLHSLPRLRTLDLGAYCSADAVVAALCCCPELTTLTLEAPVTSAHMGAILVGLPLLTDLTLNDCEELESLSFVESVDWSQRAALQSLSIIHPDGGTSCLPVECVSSLHRLRSLTSLTLRTAFVSELDESTLLPLRPPSSLFPLLTQFRYVHEHASAFDF